MLIVDLDALQPIYLLNLVDNIVGKLFSAPEFQDIAGSQPALNNDVTLLDMFTIENTNGSAFRNSHLMWFTQLISDHQTHLGFDFLTKRDHPAVCCQDSRILGLTRFE